MAKGARKERNKQAKKQTSKQVNKQASKQAGRQASKQPFDQRTNWPTTQPTDEPVDSPANQPTGNTLHTDGSIQNKMAGFDNFSSGSIKWELNDNNNTEQCWGDKMTSQPALELHLVVRIHGS